MLEACGLDVIVEGGIAAVRRLVIVGSFLVVIGGVVGCSETDPGVPRGTPVETSTTNGSPSTTRPAPSSTKSTTATQSALDDVEPCELISASDAKNLGITTAPREESTGGSRSCRWRVQKGSIADSYEISVALYSRVGMKDIDADGEIVPLKVGSHDGAQSIRGGGAGCAVTIGIGDSSRADVLLVGGDGAKLCAPALDVAKLVEPELP